jgi:hypothetical protein
MFVSSYMPQALNVNRSGSLAKASISYGSSQKWVVVMWILNEILWHFAHRRFGKIRCPETRCLSAKKGCHIIYTNIFREGDSVLSFAAFISMPEMSQRIEKRHGAIHAASLRLTTKSEGLAFDDIPFDNYSQEVNPHVKTLGNQY